VKRFLSFLIIGAGFFQFSACKRDGGPSWDTGIVLPLAHASLSIDNLLADSLSVANADGSVKLVYSTKFLGLQTDTLFNIPDTTISNLYALPLGYATLADSSYLIPPNTNNQTAFGITTVQLLSGILSSGTMSLRLQNDMRKRVEVRYQIPCATLNSMPFDTSFILPAAPDSLHSTFVTAIISLAGYQIDFSGINHDRVNTITTSFTARIDPTDLGYSTIYPSDTVAAINTFSGIKPYYIRGYFGNQTLQIGPDETDFSLFKKIQSGTIGLDSLKMSISIDNYIGMDSRLTINGIWSHNTHTNQTVHLNNSVMGTPINVNRAQYSNSWLPVIPSSYNFVFDNSNSNAKALVENLPDKLGYDVTLITNPLGNVSGNNDFLFSQYGINAMLNVEMPLNLFADQLVITDTVVPDFSSVNNEENILKGTLSLYAANSFPFDAAIDVYFLDVNGNVTGSVVSQPNVISSGPVAMSGGYLVSVGFSNSLVRIPLTESETQALFHSSKIVFVSKYDTNSNPAYAKIFESNRLDLKLSADFDYRIGN
jgi:hypothetical protein